MNQTTPARQVFAERLRALRLEAKMTQQETADRLGIKRSTYAYYETQTSEPDLEMLGRIAKLFRTTVNYLSGGERQNVWLMQNTTEPVMLSSEEQQVMLLYHALNPEDRSAWISEGKRLADKMIAVFPDEDDIKPR